MKNISKTYQKHIRNNPTNQSPEQMAFGRFSRRILIHGLCALWSLASTAWAWLPPQAHTTAEMVRTAPGSNVHFDFKVKAWQGFPKNWYGYRLANNSIGMAQYRESTKRFEPLFCVPVNDLTSAMPIVDWDFAPLLKVLVITFFNERTLRYQVNQLDATGNHAIIDDAPCHVNLVRIIATQRVVASTAITGQVRFTPLVGHEVVVAMHHDDCRLPIMVQHVIQHNVHPWVYFVTMDRQCFRYHLLTARWSSMPMPDILLPVVSPDGALNLQSTVLHFFFQPMHDSMDHHRIIFLCNNGDIHETLLHLSYNETTVHDQSQPTATWHVVRTVSCTIRPQLGLHDERPNTLSTSTLKACHVSPAEWLWVHEVESFKASRSTFHVALGNWVRGEKMAGFYRDMHARTFWGAQALLTPTSADERCWKRITYRNLFETFVRNVARE